MYFCFVEREIIANELGLCNMLDYSAQQQVLIKL